MGEIQRDATQSILDHMLASDTFNVQEKKIMSESVNFQNFAFALDHYNKTIPEYVEHMIQFTGMIQKSIKNQNEFAIILNTFATTKFPIALHCKLVRYLQQCVTESNRCAIANCACGANHVQQQELKMHVAPTKVLVATDFDGTYDYDVDPKPPSRPTLYISGRSWSEYNEEIKDAAQDMPVYIRGSGKPGDGVHAGNFKAEMCTLLGVTHFLEDDPKQWTIIQQRCPWIVICKVQK